MALVSVAAPLTFAGVVVALIVSVSTHAVIDRRWIVQAIIRAKGCQAWSEGPYLIDQAVHHCALLVAAVLAARTGSASSIYLAAAGGGALLAGALLFERRRARSAVTRTGDPYRL
jgi:hypothetical protein